MSQNIVNAVSPWEGRLHWVGQVMSGQSQTTGNPWKRVDFTLSYVDAQMQVRYITFSLSGVEKVDRLLTIPLGTTIKVTWRPSGNEYQGKWFTKNEAIGIFTPQSGTQVAQPQQPPQQYGPQYSQPQGFVRQQAPMQAPPQQPGFYQGGLAGDMPDFT